MKRIRNWLPHPMLTPVLAAIWLLLNNSLAPGQILLGLLLGWAIPRFTLGFWPERVRIRRPALLLRLAGAFIYDVIIANLSVARLILGGPRRLHPSFGVGPPDLTGELAISLQANAVCLTPGAGPAARSACSSLPRLRPG